jgi:hypothetical protein
MTAMIRNKVFFNIIIKKYPDVCLSMRETSKFTKKNQVVGLMNCIDAII